MLRPPGLAWRFEPSGPEVVLGDPDFKGAEVLGLVMETKPNTEVESTRSNREDVLVDEEDGSEAPTSPKLSPPPQECWVSFKLFRVIQSNTLLE